MLCRVVFCADFFANWNTFVSIHKKKQGEVKTILYWNLQMSAFYLQGNHWEIQMSARSKWLRTFVITSGLQFLLVLKWFFGNKYCNLLNIDLISQSIFQMVKTLVKIKMIAKRWVFIQSNFLCKNFDGCERPLAVVRACGGTHLPPRPEVRPCNFNHFPLISSLLLCTYL